MQVLTPVMDLEVDGKPRSQWQARMSEVIHAGELQRFSTAMVRPKPIHRTSQLVGL